MGILKNELYKIFTRKSVYLAAILFLVFFGLFVYSRFGNAVLYRELDNDIRLHQWEGPVTEQIVTLAAEGHKEIEQHPEIYQKVTVFPDGRQMSEPTPEGLKRDRLYSIVLEYKAQIENHNAYLNELDTELRDLEKSNSTNTFDYKKKSLHYQMLTKITLPEIVYKQGWSAVLEFIPSLGFVFMGALILLGLSPVFSEEYSTNVASILLSSKHGKRKVVTAKIMASSIYITTLVLFFSIVNMVANFYSWGMGGGASPLQNVNFYVGSPYSLTILQYYFYEVLIHLVGSVAFGLLVLLMSALSKSALIPFFSGGLVLAAPILLHKSSVDISWLNRIIELSYSVVIMVINIFAEFRVYNFFGTPILYPYVALIVILVLSLATGYLTYYTFRNHQISS